MDRLDTYLSEAKALLANASWTLRIAIVLLIAAVCGSFAWLFTTTADASRADLFGGLILSHDELARAEAVIASAGLTGAQIVGNRLSVPAAEKDKYLAALVEKNALPGRLIDLEKEAQGTFSLLETQDARKARERYATQGRLQNIITRMSGIQAATVQLSSHVVGFPRREELSALVSVETLDGQGLKPDRAHAIRLAVASQAGLTYDRVTLMDVSLGHTYQGPAIEGGFDERRALYKAQKEMYEQDWRAKVAEALSYIPGIKVQCNVELTKEMFSREHRLQLDPKPVAVRSSETGEERTEVRSRPEGRVGAVPNGVTTNAPLAATQGEQSRSEATVTRSNQESVVGRAMTVIDKAGLIPEHVSVAIGVPESYFRTIWDREQASAGATTSTSPTEKDLERIRGQLTTRIEDTVNNLLPPMVSGEDPYPRVKVSSYYEIEAKPLTPPGVTDELLAFAGQHAQTAGLSLLAVVALVMLRRMMASVTPPEPTEAPVADRAAGSDDGGDERDADDGSDAERLRFLGEEPDLREELADLVRADPDGAASVLRQWIGDAAAA